MKLRTLKPPPVASSAKGGGESAKPPQQHVLSLRATSWEEAEQWAWTLYQCAHAASQDGVRPPAAALPQKRQRGSLFAKLLSG